MKCSYVFVFLSVLFAFSVALPYESVAESEDELTRNQLGVERKRFFNIEAMLAKQAIKFAVGALCNGSPGDPLCSCATKIGGLVRDEGQNKRFLSSQDLDYLIQMAKTAVKDGCQKYGQNGILKAACTCLVPFL